ncbi:choice-of-anchor B domain-containing protein [Dokdonella fugitiva]|uniref:Choice-of-anchor B domain-containing protein n=1 Tax=Dokdonella fugitiva TaxID=328517 RepID=A0A839F326_9GAMM|nr:choice-of-anchor B family protein [Dokdonella fugitiva]MBA8889443.1 choice-of-anchor B domain-containing protein [Dokdonella fugitiva]
MSTPRASCAFLLLPFALATAAAAPDAAQREMAAIRAARPSAPRPLAPMHATPCVNGMAGTYPCSNIDLLAFVPLAEFAASNTNSLWGWTDTDGSEYALIGADNGVAFYRLTDPTHPTYLGKLPTHAGTGSSIWRDVRVYQDHAFVVSDNNPGHGMQVFDLAALRGVTTAQTFAETAWYGAFGSSHTISINEATGFAYVPGSNLTCPGDSHTGGLQMIDIHVPDSPTFAGCINDAGYTHESQCWVYAGPDTAHVGKEICVDSNGPTHKIAIVDVSNKSAPVTLSSVTYDGAAYPHQGWLTEDHRYLLVDDELDESNFGHAARTYVWDVSDLEAPVLVGHHDSALDVIDHNQYVHGQYVYQSNYEAGVRILRMDNLSAAGLSEVAYFDTYPASNSAAFNGSWNNYRFPASGHVIATGIDEGFFVLDPHLCTAPPVPTLGATPNGDHRIDLAWSGSAPDASYRVERAQGGCGGHFETIADHLAAGSYSDTSASGAVTYGYRVVALDATGGCAAPASTCVEAQTSGSCTAPPLFAGIAAATNAGTSQCRVDLAWTGAQPACGGPASYSVYRSDQSDFVPDLAHRIAADVDALAFADDVVAGGAPQYYVVRASDAANGSEDGNLVRLSATPTGPNHDGTFASGAEPGDPVFDAEGVGSPTGLAPGQIDHAGWHMSTARKHDGVQSFWSTAANNLCVTLVTPPLDLSAGTSPQLSFWTAWDIEQGWDGGVVDISTDAGTTWTRLTPAGGYPGTITNGGSLCGITQGSGAFTGTAQFTFTQRQVDLSVYAGQSVKLRWLYRTDTAQTGEGWFVDDIALTHAQVPGACTIGGDAIFANGFDAAAR